MSTIEKIYSAFEQSGAVSTDTRNIAFGSVFFALRGANFNGNKFVMQALELGASMAIGDQEDTICKSCATAQQAIAEGRIIIVDDVLSTLQQLAQYHRQRLNIPILAITGSNGKTTTKELLSCVLARKFKVSVTQGNLNNHIGVPLTLLRINPQSNFAIVEMGASNLHEIELLANIAQPNYGLITNIGKAHLEGFGDQDGVRRGKGELADFLDSNDGTLFYLSESEQLLKIVDEHPNLKSISYSTKGWNMCKGTYVAATFEGLRYQSHLTGDYNIYNIAAAETVGRFFEISPEDIAAAIESYVPSNNRSQRVESQYNTIICDAYNANPSSMSSAIDAFINIENQRSSASVILGSMLELGSSSKAEHLAIYNKVHLLILHGKLGSAYFVGSQWADIGAAEDSACMFFDSTDSLRQKLISTPIKDSIVLVKGSHSIALEKIFEQL